jgi:GMP synthase (glutamine-hydrolysing)
MKTCRRYVINCLWHARFLTPAFQRLAVVGALGGSVRLNPKGREFGVARTIVLSDAGRSHALYAGKRHTFDALCSHQDEVATLPAGSTVLASNSVSEIQAAEIAQGHKSFWGVQYHPEMDFGIIAMLLEKRATRYIQEGFAADERRVTEIVADLRALETEGAARKDLVWRYGLTPEVLDAPLRRAEFGNWLTAKVRPFAAKRA